MRRAAMILFNLAAALSLLLCLAAAGAWGWGQTRALEVARGTGRSFQALSLSRHEICLEACHMLDPQSRALDFLLGWDCEISPNVDLLVTAPGICPDARPPVAGFFVSHTNYAGIEINVILLPMWFVVAAFALLPCAAGMRLGRRRRRAKRLAAGHCIACGYDLRASPERCPECGRESRQLAVGSRP